MSQINKELSGGFETQARDQFSEDYATSAWRDAEQHPDYPNPNVKKVPDKPIGERSGLVYAPLTRESYEESRNRTAEQLERELERMRITRRIDFAAKINSLSSKEKIMWLMMPLKGEWDDKFVEQDKLGEIIEGTCEELMEQMCGKLALFEIECEILNGRMMSSIFGEMGAHYAEIVGKRNNGSRVYKVCVKAEITI